MKVIYRLSVNVQPPEQDEEVDTEFKILMTHRLELERQTYIHEGTDGVGCRTWLRLTDSHKDIISDFQLSAGISLTFWQTYRTYIHDSTS